MTNGAFGRGEAGLVASHLTRDFFHIGQAAEVPISLLDGVTLNARGSVSYRFMIVLIRNATSGSFDAVIYRETLRTRFSSRLAEAERRSSGLTWSSAQ